MAPPAIEATVGNGKRKAQWVAIAVAVIVALVAVMAIDGRLRRRSEQLRDGGSDPDGADVAPSGQVPVVE
jgi:hypothetical protein